MDRKDGSVQDKSECDTEAQTVEEDDLEIISDDEPELPPGYFEDHFDDEEKHRSFFDEEKNKRRKISCDCREQQDALRSLSRSYFRSTTGCH